MGAYSRRKDSALMLRMKITQKGFESGAMCARSTISFGMQREPIGIA
jgi:hypothetical protein